MKTTLIVQNLKCGGCANTIVNKVSELENISDVAVDVENSSVSFAYRSLEDAQKVKEKLQKIGYPSVDMENTTAAKLISYLSCATGKMK